MLLFLIHASVGVWRAGSYSPRHVCVYSRYTTPPSTRSGCDNRCRTHCSWSYRAANELFSYSIASRQLVFAGTVLFLTFDGPGTRYMHSTARLCPSSRPIMMLCNFHPSPFAEQHTAAPSVAHSSPTPTMVEDNYGSRGVDSSFIR